MAAATARIAGWGLVPPGRHGRPAGALMHEALTSALKHAKLELNQLDGIIALPSLSHPRFMQANALAAEVGLSPAHNKAVQLKTIDTGGAGPVSALIDAAAWIREGDRKNVAIVGGDAVGSLSREEFLRRADEASGSACRSPRIPHEYARVAQHMIARGALSRRHLALAASLMQMQASRHPLALGYRPEGPRWATPEEIAAGEEVAPHTTAAECARRCDGAAALIVSSVAGLRPETPFVGLIGHGEASGPPVPPSPVCEDQLSHTRSAAREAFQRASISPRDIHYWGVYDCFPVCFVRGVAALGLAPEGEAGAWLEWKYGEAARALAEDAGANVAGIFPVNTHGGLLGFGAPWEVPAFYSLIEACEQLSGGAGGRQVPGAQRALVYGNGGVFSHSAVAVLEAQTAPFPRPF
eukprot:tig00021348_g20612.t1